MDQQLWIKNLCHVFLLLFCLAPMSCKKHTSNDLIVFDINANYPVKTLDIEDIADIEYLVLDVSDDEYLFRYFYTMTDSFIICERRNEVLFFSRSTGKPVSKVSRYGQGPGEYLNCRLPVYSEIKDELFIYGNSEISSYTRDGTFKLKFPTVDSEFPIIDHTFFPMAMYDYDANHLLLNGFSLRKGSMRDTAFMLISKQGGFIDVITIPVAEWVSTLFSPGDGTGTVADAYYAVRNGNNFLLTDYSSDTVYRFTPDRHLIPVLVRKPSIQKMETKIFLHSWLETGTCLFFSTQQRVDFASGGGWPPHTGYLMEKRNCQFFRTNVQMRDYKEKELILGPSVIHNLPNDHTGIIVWNTLELHTANSEGKLSGELKEVVDRLTKYDEYVFMILNFK